MENSLTKTEARILQMIEPTGSFLYELASISQLTLTNALEAAQRLDGRGYIVLDREKRFVRLTKDGLAVKHDISQSSLADPYLSGKRSYVIMPDAVPVNNHYEQISESDITEAIDAEIEKYD